MAKKITLVALVSVALFFVLAPFATVIYAQQQSGGLVPCGNPNQDPCTYAYLVQMVQGIVSFVLTYVAIPIATIVIVWGGIQMAISGGNEGKFKEGRKKVTAAAIGLVITFGAWLIINTVLKFLNIPTQ